MWRSWLLAAAVGAVVAGLVASGYGFWSAVPSVYGAGLGGAITLWGALRRQLGRGALLYGLFPVGLLLGVATIYSLALHVGWLWSNLWFAVALVGLNSGLLLWIATSVRDWQVD